MQPDSALETPRPTLKRPIEWKWNDGEVDVLGPDGRWSRERPWAADVLAALEERGDFAEMLRRFVARHSDESRAKWADYLVRRYLLKLERWGAVDLGLPPAPTTFHDRYHTIRRLGQGGFGTAYLARDAREAREVVVKRASNYYHALPVANRSLAAEARVFRACDHPGIARIQEEFEEDGRVHIARDFVDGEDIGRGKRRSPQEIGEDLVQVASIVGHLHERGFLMLDLGPANFLRRASDGRIVATDVGLCVPLVGETVHLESKVGSPGFASPELRIDLVASARSDVWSLGALGFALTLGIAPHEKWREAEYKARLPDTALSRAILTALATDPAGRPATMRDAAQLFEEAARERS